MTDEEWVRAAMTDDSMVVELLVKLNQTTTTTTPRKPALPLEWSVRQRRSRSSTTLHPKKPTPRDSPTTPLSWSGATSISGGAVDGFEESSRTPSKRSNKARSKVTGASETATSNTKKSRKKKTLEELKEEEIKLLKERRHLKRELATLRTSLEKQRATNESLKKMKHDLQSQPSAERPKTGASDGSISGQSLQKQSPSDHVLRIIPSNIIGNDSEASQGTSPQNRFSDVQKEEDNNSLVELPDLNLPFEDDLISAR